jgi:methionyl-tRNA formyltransferase
MAYIFCAYRSWALELYEKITKKYNDVILVKDPKKLTFKYVTKINPKLIFFPDWSWIIPENIINNFNCICIHESNLPKFRGGSPIQNQIIRGIKNTKSTAFFMSKGIDTGDIISQRNLSLDGSLNDIFSRIKINDYEMIVNIIQGKFKKRKQKGKSSYYKRRKPEESELKNLDYSNKYIHDFIRMLSDPYPNAFIKIGKKKLIFKSASYKNNKLEFYGELK